MNHHIQPSQARVIRELVENWSGIILDENDVHFLEFRLRPLLKKFDCEDYSDLVEIARRGGTAIRTALVDAVTTNETSWFRDVNVYRELREEILPGLIAMRGVGAPLDIWSAACSTGQEPYTVAMLCREIERLHEIPGFHATNVRILATDICQEALAAARKGVYDSIAIKRGLPPEYIERYTEPRDGKSAVTRAVKDLVRFDQMSLMDRHYGTEQMDLILLRNVLIYFNDQTKRDILDKAHRRLRPGGILLVGGAENAARYSNRFEAVFANGMTYYRKADPFSGRASA
ncbi:MAG TPA: protein-glutamate O-methyltransferase CheR [Planctomycetes bacterium]|nr:protein-glutamate O-methyltransferase CheR [Planctomycetota bacterium]